MWLLAATAAISAQDWAVGTFRVSFGASQTLSIFDAAEQLVWQSLPSESFVAAAKSNDKVVGCSTIKRRDADRCSGSAVNASSQPTSSSLVLSGGFESPCDTLRWLALQQEDGGEPALNFSLSLVSDGSESVVRDRVFLVYGRGEGERFYGFGQQYSHLDAADSIVPMFSREGGIGRGLEPITAALNAGGRGVGGNDRTTYSATPLYMTSELRSLHLTSPEPAEFDLRSKASRGRVSIELSATRMTGRLMRGASALELLSRVTAFTGRQRPLPSWAHAGAVVGIQGGTARVLNLTARLLAANASVAGVWLQDWAGAYAQTILNMTQMRLRWNWVLDRQLYPEWEAMVASLSARGVRTYTYVNSFLQNLTASLGNDSRYGPAYERGVLLLGPDNATTVDVASGPGLHAGLLDLSTARGRDFAREMVAEMIGVGSSGWMADFGEYLPLDSTPRSSNGATFEHNRYPLQWQQANAAAVAAVAAGEDAPVWFARSSALTSPGVVPLFWLGDQMPSWDGDDGLASTITAMLSSGVSGHALTHSDTGGYTTVVAGAPTRSRGTRARRSCCSGGPSSTRSPPSCAATRARRRRPTRSRTTRARRSRPLRARRASSRRSRRTALS